MADHPNVALLRRGFEAFDKRDLETVDQVLADDVTWHVGGSNQFSGTYEGKQTVLEYFMKLLEFSGDLSNEIHDILANDEHGVALTTSRGTRHGQTYENHVAWIFHVANGQATEVWGLQEDQAKADAFFSS
jgi:uncharacterized protein